MNICARNMNICVGAESRGDAFRNAWKSDTMAPHIHKLFRDIPHMLCGIAAGRGSYGAFCGIAAGRGSYRWPR